MKALLTAGACLAALIGATAAQTEDTARRAITPTTGDSAPGGAMKTAPADVDWSEVQATLAEMRKRDGAYERQVRAMETTRTLSAEEREKLRPKGVRAAQVEKYRQDWTAEAQETRVPMLAPMRAAEAADAARVFARENAYSIVGKLPGGASYEFLGTRMRTIGGGDKMVNLRRAELKREAKELASIAAPYFISRHEQGVDLSFNKFNVAYHVSVYCPDVAADPRCANDEFILSIADNLALLNEQRGETP